MLLYDKLNDLDNLYKEIIDFYCAEKGEDETKSKDAEIISRLTGQIEMMTVAMQRLMERVQISERLIERFCN